MSKKFFYTTHILFRLANRALPHDLPKYVVTTAERLYLDTTKNTLIAIKDVKFAGKTKTFAVAFFEEGDTIKLITIHRLKRSQEFNRINTRRWLRIRKKN